MYFLLCTTTSYHNIVTYSLLYMHEVERFFDIGFTAIFCIFDQKLCIINYIQL